MNKLLIVPLIASMSILSFAIYLNVNIYSMTVDYVETYQVCNSDDLYKLDGCKEIWNVYYVEDGRLGTDLLSGSKRLGQAVMNYHIIFVEVSKINIEYYDNNLQKNITVLEHELEHMRCGCDFHG